LFQQQQTPPIILIKFVKAFTLKSGGFIILQPVEKPKMQEQSHVLFQKYLKHKSISTDTRHIQPKDIFFALKGENFDGNKYAGDALAAGAQLAVVDDPAVVK